MRLVLVCDDEEARRAEWVELLSPEAKKESLEIKPLEAEEFHALYHAVVARRSAARAEAADGVVEPNDLDATLVLVVDRDLLRFNPSVDGEEIAYLARCYSRCGAIVGLNKYGDAAFDLTLTGHLDSFADINLGGVLIGNPGLWREPFIGFRPWSWPLLPQLDSQLEARANAIRGRLDEPILKTLGFPADSVDSMPRSTLQQLGPDEDPRGITFSQFLKRSEYGMGLKDQVSDDDVAARVAAARIGKWLERSVLPGQDVLVDAPHLVGRRPEFLRADASDLASWNAVATLDPSQLDAAIDRDALPKPVLVDWVSRPVWWNAQIPRRDGAGVTVDVPDLVFCEDLSRFMPREATREFVADVDSPFARRYVLDVEAEAAIEFLDLERQAGASASNGTDPAEVAYRPALRFAL